MGGLLTPADHAFLTLSGGLWPLLCPPSTSASCPLPGSGSWSSLSARLSPLSQQHHRHNLAGGASFPGETLGRGLHLPSAYSSSSHALFWPGGTNSEDLLCLPRASFALSAPGRNSLCSGCLAPTHLVVRSCSGAMCFGQLLDRPLFYMELVLFGTFANTKGMQHSRHMPAGIAGACLYWGLL